MEVANCAPIIVFNYNRPSHSEQTWDALSRNIYASESDLYLYCDGPRVSATREQKSVIQKVHDLAQEYALKAKKERKFKNVYVVASSSNRGLAGSIIKGVTDVINQYGKVIVVEDDLVTSPFFLKYMNFALEFYEAHPAVFCVSANRPPRNKMYIPDDYEYDVFVSLMAYSTGWATWKNRWAGVDWTMSYYEDLCKHPQQIAAFNRGGEVMMQYLSLQYANKIDSWAIRFNYAMFSQHCVAILPCLSYVDNIGFDGTGVHSGTNAFDFHNDLTQSVANPRFLEVIYEDSRIINQFASYYALKRLPLWKRIVNRMSRMVSGESVFLKKKVYV